MIWQINYMLQVSLFSLPEKHSRFIGSIFSSLFHLYVSHSKLQILCFLWFSTFLSETVFLNLHVNGVAFSEERLSLFFIIYMILLPFAKFQQFFPLKKIKCPLHCLLQIQECPCFSLYCWSNVNLSYKQKLTFKKFIGKIDLVIKSILRME